jgi:hypothetical protein
MAVKVHPSGVEHDDEDQPRQRGTGEERRITFLAIGGEGCCWKAGRRW